jgi:hypothetical protein
VFDDIAVKRRQASGPIRRNSFAQKLIAQLWNE